MRVEQLMENFSDEQMGEVTMLVFEWFSEKGRAAAQAVAAAMDDPSQLEEGMSWLESLRKGKMSRE